MDLTILFSPLDESIHNDISSPHSFFKNIKAFTEKMPEHRGAHIALIGVREERGSDQNKGSSKGPDEIRRKLYRLKKGTGLYNIVDLGNLNPGVDLDETYVRVS